MLVVNLQVRFDLRRYYGILATQAYKNAVLVVDIEEATKFVHLYRGVSALLLLYM